MRIEVRFVRVEKSFTARNILFFTVKHFVSCCETLVESCSEFHVKKMMGGKNENCFDNRWK